MPPKRPPPTDLPSGSSTPRERKRVRIADARAIPVQRPDAGPSNPGPGPRERQTDSMRGLPAALDVERFTDARAWEIAAMQGAMRSAQTAATTRAFQSVPRHLRRRAASHDVRRLPSRLRERAKAEMDAPKRPPRGPLPQPGLSKRLSQADKFRKRQLDKTWLETHLHHARRMHMTPAHAPLYGHALALTPTAKSFRPSLRAALHGPGAILHDLSYYSTVQLDGREGTLKEILRCVVGGDGSGAGAGPGAVRYLSGGRAWEGVAFDCACWPGGEIGPLWVAWRPLPGPGPGVMGPAGVDVDVGGGGGKGKGKQKGKQTGREQPTAAPSQRGKGKDKQQAPANPPTPAPALTADHRPRTLWIRLHPACFGPFVLALQRACSLVLDAHRPTRAHERDSDAARAAARAEPEEREGEEEEEETIALTDLRGQVLAFELMGPGSTQVLRGALQVVKGEERGEFKDVWRELRGLQSPGSVPRGMILGLEVYDPRLSFPPKNAKPDPSSSGTAAAFTHFPSSALAQSSLWDPAHRTPPTFRKAELDARRARQPVPGTPLRASAQDGRVPVLLVQRTLGGRAEGGLHGWTLLLPAGWGMAVLPSLLASGTLLAGQHERHAQHMEAAVPFFPRDWVWTAAGAEEWARWEAEEGRAWGRRPKGKRGGEGTWRAEWGAVLGLAGEGEGESKAVAEAETLDTQREEPPAAPAPAIPTPPMQAPEQAPVKPWLLRGPDLPALLKTLAFPPEGSTPAAVLHQHITSARAKLALPTVAAAASSSLPAPEALLRAALVHVRIVLPARGCPGDLASIYSVSPDEGRKWRDALSRGSGWAAAAAFDGPEAGAGEEQVLEQLGAGEPEARRRIGYVTTGNYSMQRGKGHAIGAVGLAHLVEIVRQERGENVGKMAMLVKVRDRDGMVCRAATLEL